MPCGIYHKLLALHLRIPHLTEVVVLHYASEILLLRIIFIAVNKSQAGELQLI